MNALSCDCRLSQLPTIWSAVCQAHHGPEEAMRSARQRLLRRYGDYCRPALKRLGGGGDAA